MENEYREKPEPNPMDAVRNKPQDDSVKNDSKKKDNGSQKKNEPKSDKPKKTSLVVQILNGDILMRDFALNNLTFIFFILLILLLMVAKGYYGKQLQQNINDLQADVDAKTADYVESKAKLEESTSRYKLVQKLEGRGLKEAVDPVKVIRINKKENE